LILCKGVSSVRLSFVGGVVSLILSALLLRRLLLSTFHLYASCEGLYFLSLLSKEQNNKMHCN
jgi:hypothetical protein